MPSFSKQSANKLATCHKDLQTLFNDFIQYYDIQILYGFRSLDEQMQLYKQGRKFVDGKWIINNKGLIVTYCDGVSNKSKHNLYPALAVDIAPYPIQWNDERSFSYFAGLVMETYRRLEKDGIITSNIRWGGDWNGNGKTEDESFVDLPHFEIVN